MIVYIIKLFAHIYLSAIAGQKARQNGLIFFKKPKNRFFSSSKLVFFYFHGHGRALQLVLFTSASILRLVWSSLLKFSLSSFNLSLSSFNSSKQVLNKLNKFEGIVDAILNDPTFIEWHVRFTTVPLKAFLICIGQNLLCLVEVIPSN